MFSHEGFEGLFPKAVEAGWTYVDDSVLECPCGDLVEWDGQCPEGHVSPFRKAGII